ncbi:GntR family transcriptional regulator [Vagococcus fluvialis]|uniref:HTH gntR-type domain-containing protein n=1 Tax=Vagococcus fluvialis TaxID=2738 RepID=A0A430A712_9ENTE|nr:GntR family transcriptional regulator [Vagococcus fluvialis]RSU02780.1 hypothetical protein CBF32_05805 [Vagococcus fluvialis]
MEELVKKSRMQQMAYDYIKNNIIEGRWVNDVRLVEQDISNELSISRTPIREAINCLIIEGYLEKEANRGVIVKKQTISTKEFIERTQLLELLLSNYLFQLQVKHLKLPTDEVLEKIEKMKAQSDYTGKQKALGQCLESFLIEMDNQLIKQLVISNFEELHYVKFPNVPLLFLYDEVSYCLTSVCTHILSDSYELCRKDIRVFFNRLNLELIDQQV